MAEVTLEQRIALVSGWLQKAELFRREPVRLRKEDLPPGYALQPGVFLKRQYDLAKEAVAILVAEIMALRQLQVDAAAIASYKSRKAAEQLNETAAPLHDAHERLAELSRKISEAKEATARCDRLLRLLHGKEKAACPDLPLFQYALAWERFQNPVNKEDPGTGSPVKRFPVSQVPGSARPGVRAIRSLERVDKVALSAALMLSLFIVASGYLYIHSWGRLHMDAETMGNGMFRVTFTNSFGEPVRLSAPYNENMPVPDTARQFGVSVEMEDSDGNIKPMDPLDVQWTYKDQPGHLYGPILISPLSSEEVFLQILPKQAVEQAQTVRIRLYLNPHHSYAVKNLSIR